MASAVLQAWDACDKTDTLFVLVCTVFCWTIVPTVGIAYSGYSWKRNGMTAAMPAVLTIATCSIQWFVVGYTLAYGDGGWFFGDFKHIFHRGVLAEPVGTIPAILFSEFQLVFEATVCAIAVGGFCERGRLWPVVFFIALWSTFIYCPLAHMVWGGGVLGEDLGVLDFAGGTPVHVCSGATASAVSIYLSYPLFRSRKSAVRTPSHIRIHRPGNSFFQLLAMIIIWGAWLAFDAGTTLALNFQSVMALCVTNLCASSGALTWVGMTYFETGKWSLDSTFMGAISGLVMITPAAGFIDMPTAFFFGIFGAALCRQALRIKFTKFAHRWRWVDNGDTFATHCVGGIAATIFTGLFAQKEVAAYGGVDVPGGVFFDGNIRQLWVQIVEVIVGFTWSFVGSYVIIALIDCVPGLEVLALDKHIHEGLDLNETEESLSGLEYPDEEDYAPTPNGILALE
ncbi:ammonium transporter AmtB-like domain-containing protein [Lasiosphaeria hispida]|uniref:Ammonium transporter AmtB-like domain-containing protein n=1 Tax=Lasiosphaeria hispida TaxID=260671 RepID=A0AAJ0HHQ8_9PEZI|nr:ammonium transporter AmtB-like domain-containing protein [Lasiosphaeria hispida]